MGRRARVRVERLPEKLLQIREALGLSQSELHRRLDVGDLFEYRRISEYELGKSEPPLPVLLRYAKLAGVCTDILIDDDLDLPARIPAKPKHGR
jgi:transcriptional regulator with XRE-family HTH domain